MNIVVIHGIRHYRPDPPHEAAQFYAARWRDILLAGRPAKPVTVTVAYYAHHLTEPGRQGGELDADAAAMLAQFLAPWTPDPTGSQGYGTWPLRQAISALANHFRLPERPTRFFLERFFSEVAAYLRVDGHVTPRADVLDSVTKDLTNADIVIAHSLGSVVAYEALWQAGTQVPCLVTLGSPLALPQVIFPRLNPAPIDGQGKRPPGVEAWFNIADHGDIIAVPPFGVGRSFEGVTDDRHDHIADFGFHSIENYLRCNAMKAVLAWASPRPA